MFDLSSFWSLGLLFGIFVIVSIIENKKTKDLPPNQKALSKLFYAFAIFGIFTLFLVFSLPHFYDYTSVPEKINTLDEAQKILLRQNESLEKVRDNLNTFKWIIYLFLLFFATSLLPAIHNFAKAITPADDNKPFNADDNKSIFGLDDE